MSTEDALDKLTPDLVRRMQDGTQADGTCIHCNRCMVSIYSGSRCVVDHPEPIVQSGPVA